MATEDILHVVRHAIVIDEIAEDRTRFLVLGADRAGNLLGLVVLDRSQGPARDPRDADDSPVSRPASGRMVSMATTHGTTADGTPITR